MSEYSKRVIAKLDAKRKKDEDAIAKILYDKELLDDGMSRAWSELQKCVKSKCSELNDDGIEVALKEKSISQISVCLDGSELLITEYRLRGEFTAHLVNRHFFRKFEMKQTGRRSYLSIADEPGPIMSIDAIAEEALDALLGLRSS